MILKMIFKLFDFQCDFDFQITTSKMIWILILNYLYLGDLILILKSSTYDDFAHTCRQCSATYIGETKKQLRVRISQHKGISFRTDRPLSSFESSKIYEHPFDSNHPISDHSFKILSNSTVFDLKVLESLNSHKFQPNLNDYNTQCVHLIYTLLNKRFSICYSYLFDNFFRCCNIK